MKDYEPGSAWSAASEDETNFLGQEWLQASDQNVTVIDGSLAENGRLLLPIGNELLQSEFSRTGSDLFIHHQESLTAIIQDYFASASPVALVSETGKQITGHAVELLAGPEAPGQFAGPDTPSDPIGTVEKLQGDVTVKRADGTEITLKNGDPVFQDDVIHTGSNGDVGIKFIDGSVFTLGSEARMTLDELVYDPQTGEGHSDINVINGMFKFVSGDIAANNPGDMKVHTPVATIGIRGTTGGGNVVGEGGDNQFYLEPNADGTVGWFDVITDKGTQSLNEPNMMVDVQSITQAPPPPVYVPPAALQQRFGEVMQFAPPVDKYNLRLQENPNQGQNPAQPGEQPQGENTDAQPPADGQAAAPTPPAEGGQAAPANPTGEAAPAEAAAEGEPTGDQPNAALVTDQMAATETPAENTPNGEFTPFTGDVNFDGQAANAPVPPASDAPPAFIATAVASADVKPGFTTAGDQGFISVPQSMMTSAFAPAMVNGQPTGNPPPQLGPDGAPLPGVIVTGDMGSTTVLGAPLGDVLPPVTPVPATFAPPPITPTGPVVNTSDSSRFLDIQIDQGIVPPVAGAPMPPAPGALPPAPPPPVGAIPPAPPPPTGTGTGGTTGGTGGGAPAGGGTAASMAFLMTNSTAPYDNFVGDSGNDFFRVTNPDQWSNSDTLAGGSGFDTVLFETSMPVGTPLLGLEHKTGIENIVLMGLNNNIQFDTNVASNMVKASDTGKVNLTLAAGSTNTLSTIQLAAGHDLMLHGGGTVNLSGTGNRVAIGSTSGMTVNGGGTHDMVLLDGATNLKLNFTAGPNRVYGRNNLDVSITGGAGAEEFYITDSGNVSIVGGTGVSEIELKNTDRAYVNSNTGNNTIHLSGNNSYAYINGGMGSDTIEISGSGVGMSITGGNDGTGVSNSIYFRNYGGQAVVDAYMETTSYQDTLQFSNLTGVVNVNQGNLDTTPIYLEFADQSYSNLSFAMIDEDMDGATDDLRISTSHGGQVNLMNFTGGSTDDYKLFTRPEFLEFGLVKNGGGPMDMRMLNTYTTMAKFLPVIYNAPLTAHKLGFGANDYIQDTTGTSFSIDGGDGDDTLIGGNGNTLIGGNGNDVFGLLDGQMASSIDGGAGFNTIDVHTRNALLNIDLSSAPYNNIQGVIGTRFGETITLKDTVTNFIEGGDGGDTFTGGLSGYNTLSYKSSINGVTVDISGPGVFSGGDAQGDVISGSNYFTNLVGSANIDNLTATGNNNGVYGGSGNDVINVMGGADTVIGGSGDDTIYLGAVDGSRDRVRFESISDGADTIHEFETNMDIIDLQILAQNVLNNGPEGRTLTYFDLIKDGFIAHSYDSINNQTLVTYDIDGRNGGNGAQILAKITGNIPLEGYHFLLTDGQITTTGGSSHDMLIGSGTGDNLTGNGGNDIFFGKGGFDGLDGGGDNDSFVIDLADITGLNTIQGGAGFDQLILRTNVNGSVDLGTLASKITGMEKIFLHGTPGTVTLTGLTAANVNAYTSGGKELEIVKDADDTVNLSGWTQVAPHEPGYTTYQTGTGANVYTLHIQNNG